MKILDILIDSYRYILNLTEASLTGIEPQHWSYSILLPIIKFCFSQFFKRLSILLTFFFFIYYRTNA